MLLAPSTDYSSPFCLDGDPILPPLMTPEKRRMASEMRQKAMALSYNKRKAEAQRVPGALEVLQEGVAQKEEEEEESPVLSAYASRFGSGMEVQEYLSGLSIVSPKRNPSDTTTRKPSREALGASISELDRQRDEAVQRFLEEQSKSLFSLKKSFAEERKRLLTQLNASPETHRRVASGRSPINRRSPLSLRQKKALSRLPGLVKGYLVRRLMATSRVQGILNSLKESLKMALQLHQEAARYQRSNASDVNLHKNLLQQINRDVRKFHDIFFESSPGERMRIIALDREERKKNKKPTQKFLSEATKQRIKQKQGTELDVNKENNKPKKSPTRPEKGPSRSSPRKVKASPRTKKSARVPSSST